MTTCTIITATRPSICTKSFSMVSGKLEKKTVANIVEGQIETRTFETLAEFAALLEGLQQDQCMAYGLPATSPAGLITEKKWHELGRPKDKLPRTKETFSWASGPGIMLLDYDAPKDGSPPMSRDALVSALASALSGVLDGYDYLWWPSTSSCIYDGETELVGIKGQRIYLLVKDARDIERAGGVLCNRLWALGFGRYEVSQAGSLLERPLFDASVWQTNRIDFAAGAACIPPLVQIRGTPDLVPGFIDQSIDTRLEMPDLTADELAKANEHKAAAKALLADEARLVREVWLNERATEIIERKHPPGAHIEIDAHEFAEARKIATRAAEHRELMGDWVVTVLESGKRQEVAVLDLLDHAERYHGCLTLDPLEPDYDGGRAVGKLFLMSARPRLHSMAHGGVTFKLYRQPQDIELVKGKMHETTNALLAVLKRVPDVFDFGTELVTLGENGKLLTTDQHSLQYVVGGVTQFWHWRQMPNDIVIRITDDPPAHILRAALSLGVSRGLKSLDSVITAPTLRLDGSLLDSPGYDVKTRLLFDGDGKHPRIPLLPTRGEALSALQALWEPFKDFPFADALDRAVHLSALLTAAVRPTLPTSPAFAYDAPVQGSGKTLLASCVSVLATGGEPEILPPVSAKDDEEIRKRLFAELRSGARVIFWDNVVGTLDSAAMAAMITSANYGDRILGQSIRSTVPNRALLLLSGNNFAAAGDLVRRILVSRIDPATDRPFAREFSVNPLAVCQTYRQDLVGAALTLILYHLQYGESLGKGQLASFEDWDRLVRQTVIRCNELLPGQFADVMERVLINQEADPEQESLGQLLRAWLVEFGSDQVTAQEVHHRIERVGVFNDGALAELAEALRELAPNVKQHSPRSIGNVLKFRKGRIVDGLRLLCRAHAHKMFWRVV